jgi:hypothetical protein
MLALTDVKERYMKKFKVITEAQWRALNQQCDFVDYIGECIHRGETCFQMQIMSTNRVGRVVYDYVIIDPKWR